MKRLTKEQIEEIKKLSSEGKFQKDIAKIVGVSQTAVLYHTNGNYKEDRKEHSKKTFKNLSKEDRKKLTAKRKEYMRQYMRNRYNKDFQFRRKQIDRVTLARRVKRQKEVNKK